MPMALGMKDISNLGYMHCTTAVSLEMSDEPFFLQLFQSRNRNDTTRIIQQAVL